jgi:hypothetical protein
VSISLHVRAEDEDVEKLLEILEREFPGLSWFERTPLLERAIVWTRLVSFSSYNVNRAQVTLRPEALGDNVGPSPEKVDADLQSSPH